MNDCGSAAQSFNRHTWALILSLRCLAVRQNASNCILYTQWQNNTRLHNIGSIFFLQNPNCTKPAALWGTEHASIEQ